MTTPEPEPTEPATPPRDRQRAREMAELYRNTMVGFLRKLLPPEEKRTFVDRIMEDWLTGLAVDLNAVYTGICPEDPTKLTGLPIGQYHCRYCGCMVVAGIAHPPCGEGCRLGLGEPYLDDNPDAELPEEAEPGYGPLEQILRAAPPARAARTEPTDGATT